MPSVAILRRVSPFSIGLLLVAIFVAAELQICAVTSAADPTVDGSWTELPPPLRSSAALGYDSFAHRLLVFGGNGGDQKRDTWALDLSGSGGWTRVVPQGTYDGNAGTLFLDDQRHRLVLFQWPRTWVLDLSRLIWTSHTIPNPGPIRPASLAFDPVRNRFVFAGGSYVCGYNLLTDPEKPRPTPVWCYSRKTWSWPLDGDSLLVEIMSPDSVPDGICAAMVDPVRDRLVAFARTFRSMRTLASSEPARWDSVEISGDVPDSTMVRISFFDRVDDQVVSYGALDDIRIVSLGPDPRWTRLPTPAPTPPGEGPLTFDPERRTLILQPAGTNDVWEYSLGAGSWRRIVWGGPELMFHSMMIHDRSNQLIVFGGFSYDPHHGDTKYYSDLWTYGLDQRGLWSKLEPGGNVPSPRSFGSTIYDPLNDRMIVFGGEVESGQSTNETWSLAFGESPTWERLAPVGNPGNRSGSSAIYDPVRHRMIVFGGNTGTGFLGDVWSLTLDGAPQWQQIVPTGTPPRANWAAGATYDSRRQRMLMFQGDGDSSTWALDLTASPKWQLIASSGSPTFPGFLAACVYDSLNDRLIVNNGSEAWQLPLAGPAIWSRLTPSGAQPRQRSFPTTVSDPSRHRMLSFGGMTSDGNVNDLVALQWEVPNGVTPVLISLVSANVVDGLVRIVWQAQGDATGFTIERSEPGGSWRSVSSALPDGSGRVTFDDSAVSPGTRYGYRLIPEGGGNPLGEVWVEVPASATLSLSAPMPHPAASSVSVRVILPTRSNGVVQIIDVNGRRIASQSLASLPPGVHQLHFDVSALPAGLYHVQLRDGAHSLARRLVVLR